MLRAGVARLCRIASAGIVLPGLLLPGLLLPGSPLHARPLDDDFRKAEKGLKKAAASGEVEGMAYWVEILGQHPTLQSVKLILGVGERIGAEPLRSSVRNALSWIDKPAVFTYYEAQLRNSANPNRALVIIEALEAMDGLVGIPALAASLEDQNVPRVLIRTVQALRRKHSKEAIDALIAFYKKIEHNEDKLWAETRITLLTVTGMEYLDYQDWANWWLTQRDYWKPLTHTDEEKAATGVYRPPGGGDLDLPTVFGQEIPSKRVLFVIDTSLSMEKDFAGEAEEGSTGAGQSRLQRAQAELVRAVGALRKEVLVGIVAYNTDYRSWADKMKLQRASARNKKKAQQFIAAWKPEGRTSTGLALMRSLDVPDVDTIILLSDGSPTDKDTGKVVDVHPIIEAVAAKNRFLGVTIHTLGFKGAKVSFMRALASQNGGTYAHIR